MSITITHGDLSVHAAAHTSEWDGQQFSDMANRPAGTLVNALDVLAHTAHRLASELPD